MVNTFGKIIQGKLYLKNRRWFDWMLGKMPDCKVQVSVDRIENKRTLEQNALLWGAIYPPICAHTGHEPNELHEIFKKMFLPRKKILWRGIEKEIGGSTAKLKKGAFIVYVESIRREVADMGITLPTAKEIEEYKEPKFQKSAGKLKGVW